jgi:hypothetical protein
MRLWNLTQGLLSLTLKIFLQTMRLIWKKSGSAPMKSISMNDIVDYESRYFSTQEYAGDLKAEFDTLYAESPRRRRMMSVSAHDRIAGRPSRAKVLEEFIVYAQSNRGVAFMRKDEIARFALGSSQTIREGI